MISSFTTRNKKNIFRSFIYATRSLRHILTIFQKNNNFQSAIPSFFVLIFSWRDNPRSPPRIRVPLSRSDFPFSRVLFLDLFARPVSLFFSLFSLFLFLFQVCQVATSSFLFVIRRRRWWRWLVLGACERCPKRKRTKDDDVCVCVWLVARSIPRRANWHREGNCHGEVRSALTAITNSSHALIVSGLRLITGVDPNVGN